EAALAALVAERRPVALEVSVATGSGTRRLEIRGAPILEREVFLGATLRSSDVTDLRALEREVLDVAARERHRLSSDLHEGLGQELTGIALHLRALSTAVERGKAGIEALIREALEQVEQAIATTRDLARGMSPVQIERGSLAIALARLAADATRRLGLPVSSQSDPPDVRLAEDVSDHLYRIAAEAVTNAGRHGRCRTIAITLRVGAAAIELRVQDDGVGMAARSDAAEGLGLRMMRYRARMLDGALHVESSPGAGTRVSVSVPRAAGG
ncbi:MAG: hypothetical protein JSR54_12395, partial [Proteobacteria bacterium]|nr:hypothetical protein [Pseudomonadota bacterium]